MQKCLEVCIFTCNHKKGGTVKAIKLYIIQFFCVFHCQPGNLYYQLTIGGYAVLFALVTHTKLV
jgi:hypothetical protein